MEETIKFSAMAQSGRFTVTELCEQFGISRKTGYKHLARYAEGGAEGLAPRSSRRAAQPEANGRGDGSVVLLAGRRAHRTWGRPLTADLSRRFFFQQLKRAPLCPSPPRGKPPSRISFWL